MLDSSWSIKRRYAEVKQKSLWQIRRVHQVAVTFARRAAAFVERPHHEALAATAIAGGKDALEVRRVFLEVRLRIAARVTFDAERFKQRLFRSEKAHR